MPDKLISVLQFSNGMARGGVEEHILMLLRGFDRNRFKLHLVCPTELADKFRADVPDDVELIPLYLEYPTHVRAILRFIDILRTRGIHVLHSHGFAASQAASPLGWLCGVPLIIETAHGREGWRTGWRAKCYVDRFIGPFVDHYIAVSTASAQYLVETKRYPARKITVIHPGSDLARFANRHHPPARLKESLGFGPSDPLLVTVGRIERQKGHRVLIDALPLVRKSFPSVRLVCVGEGTLRAELESYARCLGVADAVRFVGYWPDIRDWLALAHATVLPSFHEGLPVTPVESLASGVPVIATAVDGTSEVVIDEKTGLTVPPGRPDSLAAGICRLLANDDLCKRLGQNGKSWVRDRFSSAHMVNRTEQLYLQLMSQSGQRDARARIREQETLQTRS